MSKNITYWEGMKLRLEKKKLKKLCKNTKYFFISYLYLVTGDFKILCLYININIALGKFVLEFRPCAKLNFHHRIQKGKVN